MSASVSIGIGTQEKEIPFTIAGIPVVIKLSVSISGGGEISGSWDDCTGEQSGPTGNGQICADIGGSFGVGVAIASVGVYGNMTACLNFQAVGTPKNPGLKTWGSVSGEIGVYAEVFWFRYNQPLRFGDIETKSHTIMLW